MITLVTGNPNKLREYEALLPAHNQIAFTTRALDLPEIQSLDLEKIIREKLLAAYAEIGGPVVVEDVSAGLGSLAGLPGPFIKFFEQRLGSDALHQISRAESDVATIICAIGYYDGQIMSFSEGRLVGRVVAPRGDGGFGFDSVIIPEGETRTLAEMTAAEKNAISHRAQAIKALVERLDF
jgi:non-canonical purine NTP pyrophosphatase (RdgB/HAM1 family)